MKWFPDWVNDMGFVITALGFGFAIWQILLIGKRQKAIAAANEKLIKKINSQDNLLNIKKSIETISELKAFTIKEDYYQIDKKIGELKDNLIACKRIHNEKVTEIMMLLQSLTSCQQNINNVRLNNNNTFDSGAFLSILDQIRDLFSEIIEKCKYE
jgi:hypothetical protein